MYSGILFLIGAIHSYSPNANAPRKNVEGVARFVAKASGKGGSDEYICATSCEATGGYALDLHDKAADAVKIGSNYVFTYLQHPKGNAFSGISLKVIAISDADSGRLLYHMDLANHPYRIAAYLLDLSLVIGSGLLAIPLARNQPHGHSEESTADDEDPNENSADAAEAETISLGLNSKDAH